MDQKTHKLFVSMLARIAHGATMKAAAAKDGHDETTLLKLAMADAAFGVALLAAQTERAYFEQLDHFAKLQEIAASTAETAGAVQDLDCA